MLADALISSVALSGSYQPGEITIYAQRGPPAGRINRALGHCCALKAPVFPLIETCSLVMFFENKI